MKSLRVGLIGYDGVQALDIIGPSDAFTIADIETDNGQRRPCYEVIIVGITNKPFRAESGVSFQPHTTLRNAPTLDTLIIPGGRGARIGQSSSLIAKWISSRAKRIRRIASVCTGVYALAPTGLLDGRRVTTHWRFANDVARRFPKLNVDHDALFLKDGPFYTAGGITASVDLALALIEEDYGPRVALAVARELVVRGHTVRAPRRRDLDARDPGAVAAAGLRRRRRPLERAGSRQRARAEVRARSRGPPRWCRESRSAPCRRSARRSETSLTCRRER